MGEIYEIFMSRGVAKTLGEIEVVVFRAF